jgi:outer membrane protein OmpA-like peptidoglycan-associated protein
MALLLVSAGALGAGCATKGYVNKQVAASDAATDSKISGVRTDLDQVRTKADQAYDKATLAEKLASGMIDTQEIEARDVRFAFDDSRLDSDGQASLDELANQLTAHPRYVLEILGYADATGPDRYNYRLGEERAASVERYLLTRHTVPPGRVAVVSFGEESPLADNQSSDGRAQNRRVHVRLLDVVPKPGDVPVATEF